MNRARCLRVNKDSIKFRIMDKWINIKMRKNNHRPQLQKDDKNNETSYINYEIT